MTSNSRLPRNLITRWSWSRGYRHFLSLVFGCRCVFCFRFRSLLPLITSDIIHWQTRHTGSFQIPCLGSCALSTNRKIFLMSFAKYVISGQSDTETDLLPDLYGFWFGFKLIIFVFRKTYAHFIHRRGATDYKVHRLDFRGKSIIVAYSRPNITVAYAFISSRFRPVAAGKFCHYGTFCH